MKHKLRIFIAGLVGIAILTMLFCLIERTQIVIAGYCISLVALIACSGTLFYIADSTKKDYILRAAYPGVLIQYAVLSTVVSVAGAVISINKLFTLGIWWFLLIHLVLAAFFIWRLLAMGSAEDIINDVGAEVAAKVLNWKSVIVEVEAVLSRAGAADMRQISQVRDAVRYADPMSVAELAELDERINGEVIKLGLLVDGQKGDEISGCCAEIIRLVKERGTKIKLYK